MRLPNLFSYLSLIICLLGISVKAQVKKFIINDIDISFLEPITTGKALVFSNISIKSGMVYNESLIEQSIKSLYDSGYFQFIEVKRTQREGKIDLLFVVQSKFKLSKVEISGNDKLSDKKLKELLDSKINEPLSEEEIKKDTDKIRKEYVKAGYPDADVSYEIRENNNSGNATVTIQISENPRIVIKEIQFKGHEPVDEDDLLELMDSKKRWFLSWITGSGRFNEDKFRQDLEKIKNFLKQNGYLDVDIQRDSVIFEYESTNELYITVPINLGEQYYYGSTSFTGNTVFEAEELNNVVDIEEGQKYQPEKVDQTKAKIKNLYGKKGYLETYVIHKRIFNLKDNTIGLNFQIKEGNQTYLESISIEGNERTKNIVILRELAISPGEIFDSVRMKNSESRLRNTRFFDSVMLSPQNTNIPDRKDLLISVKEDETGNVGFGGGFSSLDEISFRLELTQSNFDLFNYKSFFQGDGQKFRLELSIGSVSNNSVLSIEEPWLFERELAGGFEFFRSETNYNSSYYDELRSGFNIYLRKRLFGLTIGRLSYRLENVNIDNINDDAPQTIKNEEGERIISKITLNLTRDSRDSFLATTRGNRVQLTNQFAGGFLGGETDYWKTELRSAQFFPIFEYQSQVVALLGRFGVITPYSDADIPFFDRFFLGGPDTLRGYDHRDVGPVDSASNNEAIGGNTYGMVSAEYSIGLFDPIRLAAFYDGGFVNVNEWDFDLSDYNDNFGVGIRMKIGNNPIRLDFGFPFQTADHNDDSMQFHFSFGTRF